MFLHHSYPSITASYLCVGPDQPDLNLILSWGFSSLLARGINYTHNHLCISVIRNS
jgi:hypothetical protein